MPRAKTPRSTAYPRAGQAAAAQAQARSETRKNGIPTNLEEEIRRRAYELYEQRGHVPGHENEDWFVAEREILARYNHQQSA